MTFSRLYLAALAIIIVAAVAITRRSHRSGPFTTADLPQITNTMRTLTTNPITGVLVLRKEEEPWVEVRTKDGSYDLYGTRRGWVYCKPVTPNYVIITNQMSER